MPAAESCRSAPTAARSPTGASSGTSGTAYYTSEGKTPWTCVTHSIVDLPLRPPHRNEMTAELQRATRARYWVIVFAVTLAVIQYIDRVCISKAMPFIQRDLHFSDVQAGYVFGAFTL